MSVPDGFTLAPGEGKPIGDQVTLKVGDIHTPNLLAVECRFGPGFDVGAHIHDTHEEVFYVLEGEVELFAFNPKERTSEPGSWTQWESADGDRAYRATPGSVMYVPKGCPHAFRNPGKKPMRFLLVATPAGHEHYQQAIADLMAAPPTEEEELRRAVEVIRQEHHTEQLTPVVRSIDDLLS
ncbi:cupin domain-containing protein [Glycomyces sp. TRM65418]|uniref:cupin domain-containing protein n=1 Tax=Glycomyces sp. TRM65418 TaxID=2867006 RepID=UPI001CE65407|nr:cupin domain-containing protein [Glycomyces sp. TRM65418]MCC3761586.1 cupin domain-containing protein [Glycomyces sp. TRM65418]QZD55681.1 cupin domain-containing protein [Glycomyces sp. TRM65418]